MQHTTQILSILALAAAAAPAQGPCDIYKAGGTPCVAAHSTIRALYGDYSGKLYEVTRSDKKTLDISTTAVGGFADSAAQEAFCGASDCVITAIYDQSERGNHLTPAPAGGAVHTPDKGVNASKAPLMVSGHRVYGAYFEGGMGYRNDNTSGVAVGDDAESMYAVFRGGHFNDGCCFDYGNAETNNLDDGAGTMEAIYFGNSRVWGHGNGTGPWVMADLENGLWAGSEKENLFNPTISFDFVTAMVKGKTHGFSLKAGDAQNGDLETVFAGGRPKGYDPMKKQGAIILGIGGDNSDSAIGTFFEGAMTAGWASDITDQAVHANIRQAGYGT